MRVPVVVLSIALIAGSVALADPKKPVTTEARSTGTFSGVSIRSVIEVELAIGKTTKVELRGPSDWLPRITTTVKDGVLVIDMPGKWRKIPELKAVITTPSLSSLDISGVGDVRATGIDGSSLEVNVSGTGGLELAGAVDALAMNLSGAVEIDAKSLATKTATLDISGTANTEIHASKQLDVDISGVGTVNVYGKPAKVNKHITGVGTVDLQ